MIPYTRDPQQIIPTSSVKIIGLGGAGANMLERIALDGMEGAELLALNTDVRTLGACLAQEKIQLGVNLTKGLGAGGDPELGHQAVLEAEDADPRRRSKAAASFSSAPASAAAPAPARHPSSPASPARKARSSSFSPPCPSPSKANAAAIRRRPRSTNSPFYPTRWSPSTTTAWANSCSPNKASTKPSSPPTT